MITDLQTDSEMVQRDQRRVDEDTKNQDLYKHHRFINIQSSGGDEALAPETGNIFNSFISILTLHFRQEQNSNYRLKLGSSYSHRTVRMIFYKCVPNE